MVKPTFLRRTLIVAPLLFALTAAPALAELARYHHAERPVGVGLRFVAEVPGAENRHLDGHVGLRLTAAARSKFGVAVGGDNSYRPDGPSVIQGHGRDAKSKFNVKF